MFPIGIKKWIRLISLIVIISGFLTGCGQDDSSDGGGGSTTPSATEYLTIAASESFVKTDGSDSLTIIATLLDAARVPVKKENVKFATSAGVISSASVETDDNGNAQITFSSGSLDKANQVATITATSSNNKSASIPIQMTGTYITIAIANTEIQSGQTESATISVKDGGDNAISGAKLSFGQSGDGSVTFNDQEYKTDSNGEVRLTLTGGTSGSLEFKATSLGTSATRNLTVTDAGQGTFKITDPTGEIVSKQIDVNNGNEVAIIFVSSPNGKDVKFYTTLGTWKSNNEESVTKTPVSNIAQATLISSQAGTATITVVESGGTISDYLKVAISAPSSEAARITLEADPSVVSKSTGEIANTSTLKAIVTNSSGQVVSGAPVIFSLKTTTGGGEFINPAVVFTNSNGEAETTFTSGSLGSGSEGIKCAATIERDDGTDIATDEVSITIAGEASSISIGRATKIIASSSTEYTYPMSVLVTDSNGNPVKAQKVYLSVWPEMGATGRTYEEEVTVGSDKIGPGPVATGTFTNEDVNKNEVLDAGEDSNGNGQLDPGRSTSGIVPTYVVTDDNGVAQFNYIYQKQYSAWLKVKITASRSVYGSESKSSLSFWLPYLESEETDIPSSPWGL